MNDTVHMLQGYGVGWYGYCYCAPPMVDVGIGCVAEEVLMQLVVLNLKAVQD